MAEVTLFPNMLDAVESSPSRSTSSPSPTPTSSPTPESTHTPPSPQPPTPQPSPTQPSPTHLGSEYHPPTPHDSPLHAVHSHGSDEGSLKLQELMTLINILSDRVGVLEADLTKTKQTYSSAYTKLILRVKKLEAQIKVGKARRHSRFVLSDAEDDSSKQGRKFSKEGFKDDEGGHEKASTETELFIQEITPTEVIHEQEGSGKLLNTAERNGYYTQKKCIEKEKKRDTEQMNKRANRLEIARDQRMQTMVRREKKKSFGKAEIRPIYEKLWDFNQNYVPRMQESSKKEAKVPEKERKTTRKRQKLEVDTEKEELKTFLDVVPREETPIEIESLSTKFPIVDWKTVVLTETFMYYQVFMGEWKLKDYEDTK
ncbi:hypothetical protein Tco_0290918 [Tanacetum coccineum]